VTASRPPAAAETPFALGRPAPGILGASDAIRAVLGKIATYGPVDAPVLVTGETGTGKELVARALHLESPRRSRPFLAMNCSAVADDLFESELFGHERGSFTGAHAAHKGRFERADGGTLFLDEVGDMPLRVQAKMLRVLEDGTYERVGGERELRADVRIVAATNRPLERGVEQRWFRDDLFHRLAVLRIHVPPLRERKEDVPVLVAHFLALLNARYGKEVRLVSPEAMRLLEDYAWPGNVRELRNVLERVHVEATTDAVGRSAFLEWASERENLAPGAWNVGLRDEQRLAAGYLAPPWPPSGPVVDMRATPGGWAPAGSAGVAPAAPPRAARRPRELTDDAIRAAYRDAGGNLTQAASLLGVHRATLYRHLRRLGLDRSGIDAG
jgi:sigma-54 specific flagellar transcriptional regulator A